MTTETTKLKARLDSLTTSLSALESTLSPLFAQTLPETTVALAPIEQAKLQTLIPYLVYDLIFIYLKSKGIDPKSHPVVGELTRVKKYFDKISSAENPDAPPIGASADAEAEAQPSTFVPAKVTNKMAERAEYEAELRARGGVSSEDEGLEIINGDEPEPAPAPSGKGKGKAREVVEEPVAAGSKRRRPAIDPFAGFGDDEPAAQTDGGGEADKKKRKKEKKKAKNNDTSSKSPKRKAKK
ncbi:Sas10/Utp3/C1D family-domain-containing protein [Mycena rosella]|uniref:Exosome complex protein n=1 Tax=Mycena rosella TaxID=1033263 RepID=A0AAD7D8W0_MYCRO|nr:Sas10/Utp3/C1D family-domain-containing protein [Mycena rosella]